MLAGCWFGTDDLGEGEGELCFKYAFSDSNCPISVIDIRLYQIVLGIYQDDLKTYMKLSSVL